MKNKSRSNNSLCEKSMKMVTNVIRLSSLSIASMSLGIVTQPAAGKMPTSGSAAFIKGPSTAQFPESLRSQEPMNVKKPIAYLIEPAESGKSLYAINEKSVDGRASDYIRRVHEKNRHDLNEAMRFSAFVIPPPPRYV
ncbi:hypothetical protein RND71_010337 [Anisodus tanguticus]|uniref:Uncharacterized protein n=1 Tax=Anisodus tanguticus TaxID=243964 RepID=A0AAE1SK63_9SOLA|nr:hypothetical protein RND71_010337 [Anisodus tanguticus]